jgi:general stress protein CsbA
VKVDFRKQVLPPSNRFRPIHIKWTGIHVVAGAMCSYLVMSRLPDGKTTPDYYAATVGGIIVFVVYNLYALLQHPAKSSSPRQFFFQTQRITLTKILAVCMLAAVALSWFLPSAQQNLALLICLTAGLGLGIYAKVPPHSLVNAIKEPFTAIIFTAGIWGSTQFSDDPAPDRKFLCVLFFILTLQMQLVLAHFEAINQSRTQNLARWMGKVLTRKIILLLTVLIIATSVYICYHTEFRFVKRMAVVLMTMGFVQTAIFVRSAKPESRKVLETLPEYVGLIPLLLL